MTDFPAAHSMDTDWYAVDRDGRVARCFSGEIGPVPNDAPRATWSDVYSELVAVRLVAARDVAPADDVEVSLVAQILDGDEPARAILADRREERGLAAQGWSPHARAVYTVGTEGFTLTPLAAVPEYLEGILVFAAEDEMAIAHGRGWTALDERYDLPFAMIASLDRATFDALWESYTLVQAFLVEHVPEPHELGLYEFHHDWGYDAYQRDVLPARPIVLADLPAPLRERLLALQLADVAFADAPTLSPEAHTSCHAWGQG